MKEKIDNICNKFKDLFFEDVPNDPPIKPIVPTA